MATQSWFTILNLPYIAFFLLYSLYLLDTVSHHNVCFTSCGSTLNCLDIERCRTDKLVLQDKTCLWLLWSHNNGKMCETQITADIYPSSLWITPMKWALNTHLMMMYWKQACPITPCPSLCLRGDGGTSSCWLAARVRVTSPALCAAY